MLARGEKTRRKLLAHMNMLFQNCICLLVNEKGRRLLVIVFVLIFLRLTRLEKHI